LRLDDEIIVVKDEIIAIVKNESIEREARVEIEAVIEGEGTVREVVMRSQETKPCQ
jgi:hypothetical protein